MKSTRYLKLITVAATLALPGLAFADDIEVRSKNVIFVGDASEEDAKKLVRNLEVFRSTIIALVGLEGKQDLKPLRVYGLKTERDVSKFSGISRVAGVYTQGLQGPVFATPTKGGFENGEWSTQVALHEYSHHILHGMSKDVFPRWYDEGFANYLSSFKIEEDIITIGAPVVAHGKALIGNQWISPETVFESIRFYPKKKYRSKFYGQSWLYVHYMQNHSELGEKLPDYLSNLEAGQTPLEAFEAAFGMSVGDFNKLAKAYWRKNSFPVIQFKADERLLNPPITVRTLSGDEARLRLAEGERNFMSKKKAKSLKKTYAKLAESMGETTDILVGQAHNAWFLDEFDLAKALTKKALKTSPHDAGALTMRGDIYYHELEDALLDATPKGVVKTFPNDENTKQVVTYFEDALAIDSLDYTGVSHLVGLYGRSNLAVSPTGKKAADTMAQFYLDKDKIGERIDLARIYARLGDMTKACAYFAVAKTRVDSYDNKNVNDDFARVQAFDAAHSDCS